MGKSLSKNRGTTFERYIVDYLNEIGSFNEKYLAKRIWYSGAGLQEPMDVAIELKISHHRIMEIEAKRSISSNSMSIKQEWLDEIGKRPRHIIVLAVGRADNKGTKMFMITDPHYVNEVYECKDQVKMKPTAKSVSVNKKRLEAGRFLLIDKNEKIYYVHSFNEWANGGFHGLDRPETR